jgi:hypothetical protein
MKSPFRLINGIAALLLLAGAVSATPTVWVLNGVTLGDGGTATGTFIFDPDAGTPCGSVSPCGTYSSVDIVTTNGSSRNGETYSFVCGQNVVACTGVHPDSTEVLFLASNAADPTGDPALALFFTGVGGLPPQGLTDAGGVIDIGNSSGSVGVVSEADCINAACTSPTGQQRFSTAGTVSPVPEPAAWLLLAAGFGMIVVSRRRQSSSDIFVKLSDSDERL